MQLSVRIISNLKCELATIQELETYPHLERLYEFLDNRSRYRIYYGDKEVKMMDNYSFTKEKNYYDDAMDFYSHGLDELKKLKFWTVLDTPKCAKIILEDDDDSIVPGILMTITMDGDNASLVFFPMAMCCAWSKDPSSVYYEEERVGGIHYLGLDYDWRERPFSKIFSKFEKGEIILFLTFRNDPTSDDPSTQTDYFFTWKPK